MFGQLLIYFLFAVGLATSLLYFLSLNSRFAKTIDIGRYLYYMLTGGIIAASLFLLYNILTHNFQYTYVWSYSSRNLPLHLLISSFYAGQEGSFLLWTLMLSVLGLFIMPYARKHNYEVWVMGIYSLLLVFLLLIMIVKSPFTMIWETFHDQNLQVGFTPPDGRGLNPILQNYWIAIHPPILFLGYAAMTVPFIFAITGMIKRQYKQWIDIAMPWTLFASGILGLGIMLGGFWAYETLGWGGFWGWDPVENASLHPWLIATALVHTMLVQKRTGGLIKTNFALAIMGFVLVLFATYLTRSGVLGDASVHSFVDPGQVVNILLILLLVVFGLAGFIVLIFRIKDMPQVKTGFRFSSKEMWLSLGSILLIGLTILIIYGTTRPILPEFIAGNKAALAPSQYDQFAAPITLFILIMNAVSIYLNWRKSKWSLIFKRLTLALGLSIVLTVLSYILGIRDIMYLILTWSAWFSFFVNFELLIKNITTSPRLIGGFLAHIGISVLVIGAIVSGAYSTTAPLALEFNKPVEKLGYKFTLVEKNQIERQYKDREKYEYLIKVEKDNKSAVYAAPIVYWSDFNNFESPFFEPGIKRYLFNDLYISPKTWDFDRMDPDPVLTQGQTVKISFDTSLSVTFVRFDMSRSHTTSESGTFEFGVVVEYDMQGKKISDTLYMEMDMSGSRMNPIPKIIPGTDIQIMISGFNPKEDMSQTEITLMIAKETFFADATIKPYINFVWLGVILLVAGFFVAIFRYTNNKKIKQSEQEPSQELTTETLETENEKNEDV